VSRRHDDDDRAGPGPIEAEVLAGLAREAPGALAIDAWADPARGATLRLLRGGEGAPGGERLVLLHGRGHAASIWFPCWPALAARHRLLAIDLPGFGSSVVGVGVGVDVGADASALADAEAGLRFFVDPIENLLAAQAAAGAGADAAAGFTLIGHSLGALVALELALRGRLPIRRLVLIDGMGLGPVMSGPGRLFFRLHPERLARLLGARLFGRLNPSPPTPLGRRIAALEHELLIARAPSRALAARAFDRLCPLFGPVLHRRSRLAELAVPVLLLWGEHDAALPLANATGARAELSGATLVALPRGHSPHLEAPEEALPPLLEFLAEGPPRRSGVTGRFHAT
jgi:pimeloyl-ACP methyl ester carboxylesterase